MNVMEKYWWRNFSGGGEHEGNKGFETAQKGREVIAMSRNGIIFSFNPYKQQQ